MNIDDSLEDAGVRKRNIGGNERTQARQRTKKEDPMGHWEGPGPAT